MNEREWFSLDSGRPRLIRLLELGRFPEPRQIFLFSGHVIDAPDRPEPRFPAAMEGLARKRIEQILDRHGADAEDLALSQAAAGGDLLFLEACQERRVRCRILLPFPEGEFKEQSVLPSEGGGGWSGRFEAAKADRHTSALIMPDALGPTPKDVNPFERCNLWLLYSALACGAEKVRFICLWNGGGGDGPGGTAHMYNEVLRRTGSADWIDSRKLKTE